MQNDATILELAKSCGMTGLSLIDIGYLTLFYKAATLPYKEDAERYKQALADISMRGRSHHFCSIQNGHPEELDRAIDEALEIINNKHE